MKKIIAVVLIACLCFSLAGCSAYKSHYKAVGFVHSNTPSSAFMNFFEFEGTNVLTLKNKNTAGQLKYSAKLETGSVTVYYDWDGTKTRLFNLGTGGQTASVLDIPSTGKIYIIVETQGKCSNGDFQFDII